MAAVITGTGLGGSGGAAAARRAAEQILAERRFHAGSVPRPLHGFLHAVGTLLQPLFHRVGDAFRTVAGVIPGGTVVLWTILAALFLLAIGALSLRGTRRVLRQPSPGAGPSAGPRSSADALEQAALVAERAGHLQDAVRLRFQAGLMRLAERELIDDAAATPNAQVRRALRSERFDALARRFDEIVYGGDEARAQDVEDARREWPRLVGGQR